MAQQNFGRRESQPRSDADTSASGRRAARENGRTFSATGAGRSPGKSIVILTAVGGLVVLAAVGGLFAFNAATRAGAAPVPQQADAAVSRECRGQADCRNQYDVELSCGSNGEARTVSVVALDADIAESKAERYNRECRSRSVVFISSIGRSTGVNTVAAARNIADSKAADHKTSNSKLSSSGSIRVRGRR
jgi:hypothetical protein